MLDKKNLARKFSAAYGTYENAAEIQALAAQMMGEKLKTFPPALGGRVLEIGCGTGLLTKELRALYPGKAFFLSDIAPAIMAKTRKKFPSALSLVMDGERPSFPPGSFDIIAGNLVAQWFIHPRKSLANLFELLRPEGMMILTLLAKDTFIEWRRLLNNNNTAFHFPSTEEIRELAPGPIKWVERVKVQQLFADGMGFLKHLHRLGAHQSLPDYIPLNVKEMRAALLLLEKEKPVSITYDIVFLAVTKINEG